MTRLVDEATASGDIGLPQQVVARPIAAGMYGRTSVSALDLRVRPHRSPPAAVLATALALTLGLALCLNRC